MLARAAYSVLLYLCLPAALAYLAWRGLREPSYWHGWGQRLGFGRIHARGGFWLHAASVGEVQAAVPVVRALAQRYPDWPVLVTVFTPTGRAHARDVLGELAQVRYLPLDLPGAVRRFLRHAAPRAGLVVETEIWPNLLAACRRASLPVMLINARVSQRSARRYARPPVRWLIREALTGLAHVATAEAEDAQRFRGLGVSESALTITGNIKFDLDWPDELTASAQALRRSWQARDRCVWVAASTHAGEEEAVLEAFIRLRGQYPDLLLILVPRHPQRFDNVAGLLERTGWAFARRSQREPVTPGTQVLLGDTLGELPTWYALADVAFIGGSLDPDVGGHNLLEPAALRLPVVVGDHQGGWLAVAERLEAAGALCRIDDGPGMAAAVARWIDSAGERKMAGCAAAEVVDAYRGAVERTLSLLPGLMAPANPENNWPGARQE